MTKLTEAQQHKLALSESNKYVAQGWQMIQCQKNVAIVAKNRPKRAGVGAFFLGLFSLKAGLAYAAATGLSNVTECVVLIVNEDGSITTERPDYNDLLQALEQQAAQTDPTEDDEL